MAKVTRTVKEGGEGRRGEAKEKERGEDIWKAVLRSREPITHPRTSAPLAQVEHIFPT